MKIQHHFALALLALGVALRAEETGFTYPQTDAFRQMVAGWQAQKLVITDYHIHIRGGMTPEKAAVRQERSGIRWGLDLPVPEKLAGKITFNIAYGQHRTPVAK